MATITPEDRFGVLEQLVADIAREALPADRLAALARATEEHQAAASSTGEGNRLKHRLDLLQRALRRS